MISLRGYDTKYATMGNKNANAGELVIIDSNNTVTQASMGDTFCGVCQSSHNGTATVLLGGYVEARYTGTMSLGYQNLVAFSKTNVKLSTENNEGIRALVTYINPSTSTVGFIF